MTDTIPQPPLSTIASMPTDDTLKRLLTLSAHEDITSFAVGLPSPDGFPVEAVAEAAQEVLKSMGRRALQYSVTEGEPELREAVAAFETSRGTPTRPEQVQIVTGSQQALDLVARAFLDPGDRVLVENPSYLGALSAFKLCRPRFEFLAADDKGLDPASFTEDYRGAKFAYIMPTFNNPTGLTISLDRRHELVKKARELDLWVIEDDPYGELWYEKRPPQTIRSLMPERTVRLGTLSKILSPGMRLGYIVGDPKLMEIIADLKMSADMHTPTMTQLIAARLLSSGFIEEHLPRVRKIYRERGTCMLECLAKYMPRDSGISWTNVEGGMFIWVTLPEHIDTVEMMKEAIAAKVSYVPGVACFALADHHNHMRMSFVTVPEEKIDEGVRRLAEIIRRHL